MVAPRGRVAELRGPARSRCRLTIRRGPCSTRTSESSHWIENPLNDKHLSSHRLARERKSGPMIRAFTAIILLVAASLPTRAAQQNVVVVFDTEKGTIEMEVDGVHAPATA